MSDAEAIRVNFGQPMPVFPLHTVALLPQQVLPLHIFEERYRQMVDRVLDGSGQFALAVFQSNRGLSDGHGRPPVRPAVCVANIVQHETLADGRYNLLVQGICRARIQDEYEPDPDRLYRLAALEPMEGGADLPEDEQELRPVREDLTRRLEDGPLTNLTASEPVLNYFRQDEIPTRTLLELASFALVTDEDLRYRLLAEPDPQNRAVLLIRELDHLEGLIRAAEDQQPESWPKGLSWN